VVVFLVTVIFIALIPLSFARAEVITNAVITGSYVNVRQSPTSVNGTPIVTVLYCGHRVQTLAVVPGSTTPEEQWYQVVCVDLDGVEKTGYIHSSYILPDSVTTIDPSSPFEISIAGFPESYKNGLRALHERYPNWVFQPYAVNLEWSDVVLNESNEDSFNPHSLIEDYVDDAWQSTYTRNDPTLPGWQPYVDVNNLARKYDAYNWLTDTYVPYDASRWVKTAP